MAHWNPHHIDGSLRQLVKIQATREGTKAKAIIEKALHEYLERQKGKEKGRLEG